MENPDAKFVNGNDAAANRGLTKAGSVTETISAIEGGSVPICPLLAESSPIRNSLSVQVMPDQRNLLGLS